MTMTHNKVDRSRIVGPNSAIEWKKPDLHLSNSGWRLLKNSLGHPKMLLTHRFREHTHTLSGRPVTAEE